MLTTLLKPRTPQRGSRVGAASRTRYVEPRFTYTVAPGARAARSVVNQSAAYQQVDGGTTRPPIGRWGQAPKPAPIRSMGFLLALQVAPSQNQARPVPQPRIQYFTTYTAAVVIEGGFPTQYFGLKVYYGGAVRDLCLVAEADAPSGMGGVIKVRKSSGTFAVYLVETSDGNASTVRVRTATGTKAIRLKT